MNEKFVAGVESALARAGVLHAGATWLAALSGGADSVALLHALCVLRARHGAQLCAAHVEHGLRGEPALADMRFCAALCARLQVPLTVDHAQLPGGMDSPGAEARARDARYRLLLARAQDLGAALLLAHHRDDQAETVLAHLIRGSGARGLRGMQEACRREGVLLLRPLLGTGRAAILAALDGEPYCIDETNLAPLCQRNRLRGQVMPLLAAENPRAAEHIAQSAALLAMDDAYLQTLADALLAHALLDAPPLLCLPKAPLLAAPLPVAVRALRDFAQRGMARLALAGHSAQELALSAADTLALHAQLSAPWGTALNLPHALCALAGKTHLHLVRMENGAPLTPAAPSEPLALACIAAEMADGAHGVEPAQTRLLARTQQDTAANAQATGRANAQTPVSKNAQVLARASIQATERANVQATVPASAQASALASAQAKWTDVTRRQASLPDEPPAPPAPPARPLMLAFGQTKFQVSYFHPQAEPMPDGQAAVCVPLALLGQCTLRTALPGDSIHPFGAPGGKPLRRYLTDRKVDAPFRPLIPLLCRQGDVLWAAGVGAAEATRAGQTPMVRIALVQPLPWMPAGAVGRDTHRANPAAET